MKYVRIKVFESIETSGERRTWMRLPDFFLWDFSEAPGFRREKRMGLVAMVRREQWRLRRKVEDETGPETGSVVFLSGQGFGRQIQNSKMKTRAQNRVPQVLLRAKEHRATLNAAESGARAKFKAVYLRRKKKGDSVMLIATYFK
jgi:hypothetical protein